MATFSGVGGILSNGASLQTVSDALVALNRSLTWQMENLDSDNVREIGGWNISQTSIASRNFDVGMSSGYDQTENVRFWAGNTDMNNAPFRVYDNGRFVASNADITGNITMTGGNITWGTVPVPPYPTYDQIVGGKPPADANNTYSELLFNSGIRGFVNVNGTLFLSADYIRAGTITGDFINGGTIRGVTIDVGTDLRVGNNVYIGTFSGPGSTALKQMFFNGQAVISAEGQTMTISANYLDIQSTLVDFGTSPIAGTNFVAKFG